MVPDVHRSYILRSIRHISFAMILAACFSLLAHSAVPHHHHDDSAVCMQTDHHDQAHDGCCADDNGGDCCGHSGSRSCDITLSSPRGDSSEEDTIILAAEWLPFLELLLPETPVSGTTLPTSGDEALPDRAPCFSRPLRAPPVA